jgi:hypothetical protein
VIGRRWSRPAADWLRRQRWFRGKAREIAAVELFDHAVLAPEQGRTCC